MIRYALLPLFLAGPAAAQTEVIRTPVAGDACQGYAQRTALTALGPADYPVVVQVREGRPAALAGLQVGDTVISRDGHDLMADHAAQQPVPPAPGDSVILVVRRAGQSIRLRMIVGVLRAGADGQLVCVPRSAPPPTPE